MTRELIEQLYNTIFIRKSVRKFEDIPLTESKIFDVTEMTLNLMNIHDDFKVAFRILNKDQVKGMISAKTPHYLAVYSSGDPDSIINAAFMLQQMDLWFSLNGIGSCWLGMAKPVSEKSKADDLNFTALLAFGKPDEDLHRKSSSQFIRKPFSEITDIFTDNHLFEAVRMAPSSMNRQPWYFTGDLNSIKLLQKTDNFLLKGFVNKLTNIDMGIVLCHLWLSIESRNLSAVFLKENNYGNIPDGYKYICTVNAN